ncbi:hypothetical protein [Nocardia sp. NPDC058705]|uniref:hypothetical protein n=1 Tax=Nocardia sp. NPDC058705 TaxID=3346609 RepID=UPI003683F1AD
MKKKFVVGLYSADYYPRWSRDVGENPPTNSRNVDLGAFLSTSQKVRRVDVTTGSGAVIPLFLHWSDATDLDALDRKIIEDLPHYDDLGGALFGTDMPVKCPNCGARFVGIVVEPTFTVVEYRETRFGDHDYVECCPVCEKKWRTGVLELIGRVESES